MPNIKSSTKRMELSRRNQDRNKAVRTRLRNAIRGVRAATDIEDGEAQFKVVSALLDRAAQRHLFHRKKVDRLKSHLARHLNRLRQG